MAKRFTDTDKWKKRFIRKLPGKYKLLWMFICDDCDHAGIWHVDFDVAKIFTSPDISEDEALKLFDKKVVIFDDGEKWFIPSFIEFQYGKLNPLNRAHNSVIEKLTKYDIKGLTKGLIGPSEGAMDKDKDKVLVKDMDKDKDRSDFFEEIWDDYPNKVKKKESLKHFIASVKSDGDCKNIKIALKNYKKHLQFNDWKHPQNGSTWFNNWQDWINYEEPDQDGIPDRKPIIWTEEEKKGREL